MKSRFLAIIRQYMHTGVYHSVLRLNILFTQKEQYFHHIVNSTGCLFKQSVVLLYFSRNIAYHSEPLSP